MSYKNPDGFTLKELLQASQMVCPRCGAIYNGVMCPFCSAKEKSPKEKPLCSRCLSADIRSGPPKDDGTIDVYCYSCGITVKHTSFSYFKLFGPENHTYSLSDCMQLPSPLPPMRYSPPMPPSSFQLGEERSDAQRLAVIEELQRNVMVTEKPEPEKLKEKQRPELCWPVLRAYRRLMRDRWAKREHALERMANLPLPMPNKLMRKYMWVQHQEDDMWAAYVTSCYMCVLMTDELLIQYTKACDWEETCKKESRNER